MNTRLNLLTLVLLLAGSLVAPPTLGAPGASTSASDADPAGVAQGDGRAEAVGGSSGATSAADASLDAARSTWSTMAPSQRQRVLARWNELRSLDDESRQRVLQNFNLIREASADRRDPDKWRKPEYAHRVESYVCGFDDAHRERIRSLHGEIKRVHVDEPNPWLQFHDLTPEQQREVIDGWRNKMIRQQAAWMAEYLDLTVEQQADLLLILERKRRETDSLHQKQFDHLRKSDREFRKGLLEICNGDEEQARLLSQRLEMLGNRPAAPRESESQPLPHDTMRRFGFYGPEAWMNAAWEAGVRDSAVIDKLTDIYTKLEKAIAKLMYDAMVEQKAPEEEDVTRRLERTRDAMRELGIEDASFEALMQATLAPIAERLRNGGRGRGGDRHDGRRSGRDEGDRDGRTGDGDHRDGDRDGDDRRWRDRDDEGSDQRNGDGQNRDGGRHRWSDRDRDNDTDAN